MTLAADFDGDGQAALLVLGYGGGELCLRWDAGLERLRPCPAPPP